MIKKLTMMTRTFIKHSKRVQGMKFTALLLGFTSILYACEESEMEVVSEVSATYDEVREVVVDAAFLDASYTSGSDRQEVLVDAVIRSNGGDFTIAHRKDGHTLYIRVDTKRNGRRQGHRTEGYIRLSGPKTMDVRIESGAGRVTANGVSGESIYLDVASGSIEAKDCQAASIKLLATSGRVKGERLKGNLMMEAASGTLDLTDLEGDVTAKAYSGRIRLTNVSGMADAYAVSGSIQIVGASYLGSLKTSSGNIRVSASGLSPKTALKASSGNISLQTTSPLDGFNFDLSARSGKVRLGDRQASGTLFIDHGSLHTIKGEVASGKIEIFR
jgi:lia operon protein LiaG